MPRWLPALLLVAWAIGLQARAAELSFPPLSGRVVDNAQVIDANTEAQITGKLAQLEETTGRQLVVVTLPSLEGREIEDYGYQLGRAWGIGERDSDTGALLIVAPNERAVRIEVGYGLEGILTDAVSRLIIENAILPRFRANDYPGGIQRGVEDIMQTLTGDAADFQRRAQEQARPAASEISPEFVWVMIILGLWLFATMRRRRRRAGWLAPLGIPMGAGWGGWGGSRGGMGWGRGGGGGSIFRGGGGSFGGGGASGRW